MKMPLIFPCALAAVCACAAVLSWSPARGRGADGEPSAPEAHSGQVRETLADLRHQVDGLSHRLEEDHQFFLHLLDIYRERISALEGQARTWYRPVDAWSKDFVPFHTELGVVLLMVTDASPFLDGYRLKLSLGNCQYAEIGGCEVDAIWGYSNRLHHVEQAIPNPLPPGKWAQAEITLSPATLDDVKSLRVNLRAAGATLYNSPSVR